MSTSEPDGVRITITRNGPYLVNGSVTLIDDTDTPISPPSGALVALWRCGQSDNKPFCDGTHAKVGFDGTNGSIDQATS